MQRQAKGPVKAALGGFGLHVLLALGGGIIGGAIAQDGLVASNLAPKASLLERAWCYLGTHSGVNLLCHYRDRFRNTWMSGLKL